MSPFRTHPQIAATSLREHILISAVAFVLITLTSCGGNTEVPPTSNSAVIGPAGASLTGPDGVQVVVPAGALDQPVTIRIARSSAGAPNPLDAYPVSGAIYEITPHDVSFNVPVTIRVPVGNLTDPQVFMAGPGQPWIPTTANISNGFAEWERSSFSWTYVGACFVPTSMSGDPYWCANASSHALISATPPSAMTLTAYPYNPAQGSYGEYRIDQAATLQFSQLVQVPGNCSNVTVKFLRRSWADPDFWWTPGVVAQTQNIATQSPVMTLGPHYLTGTATFTVPFSYTDGGHNQFVMAASYDCPNIVHTGPSTAGTYSWDTVNTHHTNMWGDGIMVEGNITPPTITYTIGGNTSGLTGTGLVLANSGAGNLPVAANGPFTFTPAAGVGTPYNVTVLTQPAGQTCTVTNGSGTANADVNNVAVNCVDTFTVGGSVSGLVGTGLVLQNNAADNLAFTVSGAFTFATGLAANTNYAVTVLTQPSDSTCSVVNGTGTVTNTNISNVAVTCVSVGSLAIVANGGITNGVNGLSVYRINPSTGVLSFLNNANAGNSPYAVVLSPNGLNAYVSNQMGDSVSAYSIDSTTGVLTPLTGRVSNNASGMAMDRLGRYIWVANYGWNTVQTLTIGAGGAIVSAGTPLSTLYGLPYAIAAHPTMDFVYVAHLSGFAITVYSVNPANGSLTWVQTLSNAISSPAQMVIDPSGRFAYVATQGGGVCAYRINAVSGQLTIAGCANISGATFAVAVHPNGLYAYATGDSTSNNVVVFAINQTTGVLTAVGSPVSAGSNPRGVAVSPGGNFLYVTNYVSNSVSAFSIDGGGGTLTSLGATVATGSQPQGIAVAP